MASYTPERERALLLEISSTHEEAEDPDCVPKHLYVNRDVALTQSAFCRGALAMKPRMCVPLLTCSSVLGLRCRSCCPALSYTVCVSVQVIAAAFAGSAV